MDLSGVQLLPLLTALGGMIALAGALAAVLVWMTAEAAPSRRGRGMQPAAACALVDSDRPVCAAFLLRAPQRAPPFAERRFTRADISIRRGGCRAHPLGG